MSREVMQQALEALEMLAIGTSHDEAVQAESVITALRSALAEPEQEQEPFTDDVTRLMREAGMTFHLGLPHKAVIEQMSRVVDLAYAKASIKAAQQFATELAAPTPRKPLTDEEVDRVLEQHAGGAEWSDAEYRSAYALARAVEAAHGIGEQK